MLLLHLYAYPNVMGGSSTGAELLSLEEQSACTL
jgi:hypothetical protein